MLVKSQQERNFLIVVLTIFLIFRLPGLGTDLSNSDSARWHRRSERFASAIKNLDFASTYQHYQPGVTLMWINSVVKQGGFWYQLTYTSEPKTLENADWFPIIHGASKITLVLTLFILFIYQLNLITRIFNSQVALLFGFLVAVEPYMVGIDRFFHLTSLETYLAFASFLSLWHWSKDYKKTSYIVASAVLFSLSVLSKSTSLIILPLLVLMLIRSVYVERKNAKYFVTFFCVAAAIYYMLFPALWVSPLTTLHKLIYGITDAIDVDVRDVRFSGLMSFLYYPAMSFLRFSPVTVVLFIFSFFYAKKDYSSKQLLYIYLVLYFLFFSISVKKIDRYLVSFLPPLLLLNAIFLYNLNSTIKRVVLVAVTIVSGAFFYLYFPVFSSFYSPLYFGGTINALNLGLYTNSGEYFANAAFYLNKKGRDVKTYLPSNYETFSYYYKGKAFRNFSDDMNYVVVSINRLNRVPSKCNTPEASFGSRLFKEVFIFKC